MCDLCNKIYTLDSFDIYDYDLPDAMIVKDKNNIHGIYINPCDRYYRGIYIKDILYCPKCGRNLK